MHVIFGIDLLAPSAMANCMTWENYDVKGQRTACSNDFIIHASVFDRNICYFAAFDNIAPKG
jgi:hypothetical protein